jgi:hypothetical protein
LLSFRSATEESAFAFLQPTKIRVISTEAARGSIVSSVVERPPHFALPCITFAFLFRCHPSPQAEDLLSSFAIAVGIKRGASAHEKAGPKGHTALPKTGPPTSAFARWGVTPEQSPKGDATD